MANIALKSTFLALLMILSAPSYAERGYEDPTLDWLPAALDWDQAQTVVISLDDNMFDPDDVYLKLNQPYKIILDNISSRVTHDLVDMDFFHGIVLHKMTVDGTTIHTPHVHSIQLRPNSKMAMYVVPVIAGEYEVFCSIQGHREDGMEGYITIEPDAAGIP